MSVDIISISASIEKGIAQIFGYWNSDLDCDKASNATAILRTCQQKFQNWRQTWIESPKKPSVTLETLWGHAGFKDVLKLLQSLMIAVEDLEEACQSSVSRKAVSKWKRVLPSHSRRGKQVIGSRPSNLSPLVKIMSSTVDLLCFYSRYAFDSLHGLVLSRTRSSPGDTRIWNSIQGRLGSLKLYRKYNQSQRDYSLAIDLFNPYLRTGQLSLVRQHKGQLARAVNPCYHLFIQKQDYETEIREISIEQSLSSESSDISSIAVSGVNGFNLEALQSKPRHRVTLILSSQEADKEILKLIEQSSTIISTPKAESLAKVLEHPDETGRIAPMSPLDQRSRIALAFTLAESTLHLLGTPWLASLSCRRLKKVYDEKRGNPFVLEVQTLALEDLAYEDPQALTESFQLFNLGVILIELALGKHIRTVDKNTYTEVTQAMEAVESQMGQQYREATAFCLQERKYYQRFSQPDKYDRPEETGWQAYLQELLVEYDSHVLKK